MKIITHRNQESDWCAGISLYSDSNTDMRVKTCEVSKSCKTLHKFSVFPICLKNETSYGIFVNHTYSPK